MSDSEIESVLFGDDSPRKKRKAAKMSKKYSLDSDLEVALMDPEEEEGEELGFDDYGSEDSYNTTDDEDPKDEDEEEDEDASRATSTVRAIALETDIKVVRVGGTDHDTVPKTSLISPGVIKPRFRPKEAKLSDVAHIAASKDDMIHALPVINELTSEVKYHELSFSEEQLIFRNSMSPHLGKTIKYGQLQAEQERFDKLDDKSTLTAKVSEKYAKYFPIKTIPATGRRRPFIFSSLFCRERTSRIPSTKKEPSRSSTPKPTAEKSLKITQSRDAKPRPSSSTLPDTNKLMAKLKKREPAPKVEPLKPIKEEEQKNESEPTTPKRPIQVDAETATRAPKRVKSVAPTNPDAAAAVVPKTPLKMEVEVVKMAPAEKPPPPVSHENMASLPFMAPSHGICMMIFPTLPHQISKIGSILSNNP
jgi:hypothetical protein